MKKTLTIKQAFKMLFSECRKIAKEHPTWSAFSIVNCGTEKLAWDDGYDYRPFLKINRAMIFAIAWTRKAPPADMPRLWASQAHIGYYGDEHGSRSWYEPPANYLPA